MFIQFAQSVLFVASAAHFVANEPKLSSVFIIDQLVNANGWAIKTCKFFFVQSNVFLARVPLALESSNTAINIRWVFFFAQ